MKTNPIKAKDTEILVSGKGKTLDRILNKEGQSKESIPIVHIDDDDIINFLVDAECPNEAGINLKNDKTQEILDLIGEDTIKDICFIINSTANRGREIHAVCVVTVEITTPGEIFVGMIGLIKLVSSQEIETYYGCNGTAQIGAANLWEILNKLFVVWNGYIQGTIN